MAIRWFFSRIFSPGYPRWTETGTGWRWGSSVGPGSGCKGPWSGLAVPSTACTSSGRRAGRPVCSRRVRDPLARGRLHTWPAPRLQTSPFYRHQTPIVTKQQSRETVQHNRVTSHLLQYSRYMQLGWFFNYVLIFSTKKNVRWYIDLENTRCVCVSPLDRPDRFGFVIFSNNLHILCVFFPVMFLNTVSLLILAFTAVTKKPCEVGCAFLFWLRWLFLLFLDFYFCHLRTVG